MSRNPVAVCEIALPPICVSCWITQCIACIGMNGPVTPSVDPVIVLTSTSSRYHLTLPPIERVGWAADWTPGIHSVRVLCQAPSASTTVGDEYDVCSVFVSVEMSPCQCMNPWIFDPPYWLHSGQSISPSA